MRPTLSTVEGKVCDAGLAGGMEPALYPIRCGTHGVGVLDTDSACHEDGTGLEDIK